MARAHAQFDGEAKTIMDGDDIFRSLTRIAYEIIERAGERSYVIAGIPTGGAYLGARLIARIRELSDLDVSMAVIDPTPYRDDLDQHPLREPFPTVVPDGGVTGKHVILVDDVLFTGRTVKAALDALIAQGRPASVQLAVLVDRGHREFPIRPDYIGKNIPTASGEAISIQLKEKDGLDAVLLGQRLVSSQEKQD